METRTNPEKRNLVKKPPAFFEDGKNADDAERILSGVKSFHTDLMREIAKVIVGQKQILDLILVAMLCKGHVLLEGVPGLGKTLMFRTLAKTMDLLFKHIQFTPDLMPSDIIGTEIIQHDPATGHRSMKFFKGPVFCHFLLADEINRTSPKTQSALLQSMQDREVSVGNHTYRLDEPFFVLATQNPVDQEGVYPLPEAQLDRFMFNLYIDYPSHGEEIEIARRFTQESTADVSKIIGLDEILALQNMVRGMLISDSALNYVTDLVAATRPVPTNPYALVKEWVEWGAGPRATLNIVLAAKARALLKGRYCVSVEDIRTVAVPVLRHRVKLNFSAEAENLKSSDIIQKIIELVPEHKKHL